MPNPRLRAGLIQFKAGPNKYKARGVFEYNLGKPTREALVGSDTVHGYTEKPAVPFISGEISDGQDVSVSELQDMDDVTVTLNLFESRTGPGKIITMSHGWYAHEGTAKTDGVIPVRFESEDELDEKKL